MELTKNIFFNTDKLITNTIVKISYTGKLFQDKAEEVYIHYGFGENWDNVNEVKMEKTELGFQAEINLVESTSFNFCFKDDKGNWDNNVNANYIFPIEHLQNNALVLTNLETNTPSVIIYNDTKNNIIIVGIANFIKPKKLKFCANLFFISKNNIK